jgi:hypothetical protein
MVRCEEAPDVLIGTRRTSEITPPMSALGSGIALYVMFFRDTAAKLPVKRIIVGPADGADERNRALRGRLQ